MDIFTHALLPVILTNAISKRSDWLGRRGLVAIGFAGALPDILCPHLSLEARMTSWSHGIPCWIALSIFVILVAVFTRGKISICLALVLSGAYSLHIFCDAISGGVDFLYPAGSWTWGRYWVDPVWWIPLDIVCFLICYWMFRIAPELRLRRQAEQQEGTFNGG